MFLSHSVRYLRKGTSKFDLPATERVWIAAVVAKPQAPTNSGLSPKLLLCLCLPAPSAPSSSLQQYVVVVRASQGRHPPTTKLAVEGLFMVLQTIHWRNDLLFEEGVACFSTPSIFRFWFSIFFFFFNFELKHNKIINLKTNPHPPLTHSNSLSCVAPFGPH